MLLTDESCSVALPTTRDYNDLESKTEVYLILFQTLLLFFE